MGAYKVSYERAGALNLKRYVFHGVLVALCGGLWFITLSKIYLLHFWIEHENPRLLGLHNNIRGLPLLQMFPNRGGLCL